MPNRRVYADFHKLEDENRLRLTCAGELSGIEPQPGMRLLLYSDDANDDGQPDELLADGVVQYNDAENCWIAQINWQAICHASDERGRAPQHTHSSGHC